MESYRDLPALGRHATLDYAVAVQTEAQVKAPGRICRDGPGHVAVACVGLALAPRLTSIVFDQRTQAYALFPMWMQLIVVTAYAVQLGAEVWGTRRVRVVAAAVCAVLAFMSASLFAASAPTSTQFSNWAVQFVLETWIVWKLAIEVGREE